MTNNRKRSNNKTRNTNENNNKDKDLIVAIRNGEISKVEEILGDNKINLNREISGNLPIFDAICTLKLDMVKLLVEKGANLKKKNKYGLTVLLIAIMSSKTAYYEALAKYIIDNTSIEHLDEQVLGVTPLILAIYERNKTLVEYLIKRGASITKKDSYGVSPLSRAIDVKDEEIAEIICKEISEKLYGMSEGKLPMLWLRALSDKKKNEVCMSINQGSDVNEIVKGRTLLWECCFSEDFKDLDMAEFLIKHGANMNANNNEEQKILIYSCQKNHVDVIEMMVANCADLNVVDKYKKTGLMYACENRHLGVVELLIKNDANANLQDANGKTALMYACENGYRDVVEILIDKSGIDIKDKRGCNAITYAYNNAREAILKLFIDKNAGIYSKDINNKTLLRNICLGKHGFMPDLAKILAVKYMSNVVSKNEVAAILLELCRKKENVKLVELLLDNGIDLDATYDGGKTLFIKACERNNIALVELLCNRKADVTIRDDDGHCGIVRAYVNKNKEVLEYLVRKGIGSNVQVEGGKTLLWSFCVGKKNKRIDLAKILIDGGEDVNKKDDEGKTLLWKLCENSDVRDLYAARFLIEHGADINIKDNEGKTLFMRACDMNDQSLMKFLIHKGLNAKLEVVTAANACDKSRIEFFLANDIGVDVIDDEGRSLLWALCLNYGMQDLELAGSIIEHDKDCINKEDNNGKTILAEACLHESYKDIKLIKFLLDNNAKLRYNGSMNSVMVDAVKNNYADVVSCLVECKADVNETDEYGNSLLTYACAYGYKDIVKCLVENGADMNHRTKEGRTPLMYAVGSSQDIKLVEYLIDNGAKVNARDNYDNTVLMCACAVENARIVGYLVSRGARINVKNNEGSTPLMYICNWETENVCIVRHLCECGANVGLIDNQGNSALKIARLRGYKNIDRYLKGKDITQSEGFSVSNLDKCNGIKHRFVDEDRIVIKNVSMLNLVEKVNYF